MKIERDKIYPTGKFHEIDNEGYVLNCGVYPLVQKEYEEVINESIKRVEAIHKSIIHSIYLRGSVAKGIAIHHVSDVDMIFLANQSLTREEINYLYDVIVPQLVEKYPFVNGVELHFQHLEQLDYPKVQFFFRTQLTCVRGESIIDSLPQYKLSKEAISHSFYFHRDITKYSDEQMANFSSERLKSYCSWIMKRIVRTGFEVSMFRDNNYTRDLYPNYEVFSRYYPEYKDAMFEALYYAIFPTDDVDEIKRVKENIVPKLFEEIEKHLSEYRD